MPQEFLRDVLRTGDGAGRRQRRWSVLPLSIAGHAVLVTVLLFSPWERRGYSSDRLRRCRPTFDTVAPPPRRRLQPAQFLRRRSTGAPTEAPDRIAPEREPVREPVEGGIATDPRRRGSPTVERPRAPRARPAAAATARAEARARWRSHPRAAQARPCRANLSGARQAVAEPGYRDHGSHPRCDRQSGERSRARLQPLLDDAAVRAVRQWRYTPTELNGVPVPVLMTITVRFSLDR